MSRAIKELFIILFAVIAFVYIINPGAGILEFIPDNLPIIGNLDEAAAVAILMNTLSYYGFGLSNLYGSPQRKKKIIRRTISSTGEVLKEEEVDA